MGFHKSNSLREIHRNTCLPRKRRKVSKGQLNPTLKELEKEQTKTKVSRRKEIIKIKEEINKIEMLKTIKINKINSLFFEKVNKIYKPLARLTKKRREKNPNKQNQK